MKALAIRVMVALLCVTSLTLAAPLVASAQDGGAGVITTVQQYRHALKLYDHERAVIEQTFVRAISVALETEISGLNAAQTPAEKIVVRNNFMEAKVVAIAVRQAALTALGHPPRPPFGLHAVATIVLGKF